MTRQLNTATTRTNMPVAAPVLAAYPVSACRFPGGAAHTAPVRLPGDDLDRLVTAPGQRPDPRLLDAGSIIYQDAAARGERLGRRMLPGGCAVTGTSSRTSTCARSLTVSASLAKAA